MNRGFDTRGYLKYVFVIVAMLIAAASLVVSDALIKKLAAEERRKMEVWMEALRAMVVADDPEEEESRMNNLVLKVLESNTTITVIVWSDEGHISHNRNIELPDKDSDLFLEQKLREFKAKNPPIIIDMGGKHDYLYYDDSIILKRLLVFPYVQLSVMFFFIMISFLALASTKKAEQNKVWVGLSKETAHQLGTPISSLMAWMEYLKTKNVDEVYLKEMEKDVQRLEVIAGRFSKIGSNPNLTPLDMNEVLRSSCGYMEPRISSKVKMTVEYDEQPRLAPVSESLFAWVIENLTKNAVDAMNGQGNILYKVSGKGRKIYVDVTDTGKGIPKSKHKAIFSPGYTTKTRGWGLGLSLVRRIVESHPGGSIYVRNSEVGKGTTFRIEIHRYRHRKGQS